MASSARLLSLDAFRGFVIGGMLLVNNLVWYQGLPRQFAHAKWGHGVTFTDMIFPWFLLAMGLAIPLSRAGWRAGMAGRLVAWRIVRRAAILVALGLLVDSSLAGHPVVGMGVLQLLGLAYLVGALGARSPVLPRLGLAAALLAAYWALLRYAPVPGAGAGILEEHRNVVRHLNEAYLGRYHLAGILSVIPTSALVLLGTVAGEALRAAALSPRAKVGILVAGGTALAATGWLWRADLPLAKPLWTSSYVSFAAGLGLGLLAVCYLLFDMTRLRAIAGPLAVFGTNAIAAYVGSILFKVYLLQRVRVPAADGSVTVQRALVASLSDLIGPVQAAWLYTVGYIAFWWLILLILYRRRILIRV